MWILQWTLGLLPDSILIWFYYIFTIAGFTLYVASKLVKLIPLMGQYKFPTEIVGIAVLCLGCYLLGGYGIEMAWRDKEKELKAQIAAAEAKSQQVNTVIKTKVVERIKIVQQKVEVVRTQIEKDKEAINAECKVSDTAIQDYNQAISDPEGQK
jgi:hypothetical protein